MTSMASDPRIVWLAECTAERAPLVGGKASGLGALIRKGFQVPAGFALTTARIASTSNTTASPTS